MKGNGLNTTIAYSRSMSAIIRDLDEEKQLSVLRDLKPTDLSLMNLYLQALKQEDYETCAAAKELLAERGFNVPN